MRIVVDASAYCSLIFDDEQTSATPLMQRAIRTNGGIVPAMWLLEIQNVLRDGERRGRIDPAFTVSVLEATRQADIVVDPVGPEVRLGAEMTLARRFNLTIHDATYLELALRKAFPLMTLDEDLRKAASSIGLLWSETKYSPIVANTRSGRQRGSETIRARN